MNTALDWEWMWSDLFPLRKLQRRYQFMILEWGLMKTKSGSEAESTLTTPYGPSSHDNLYTYSRHLADKVNIVSKFMGLIPSDSAMSQSS